MATENQHFIPHQSKDEKTKAGIREILTEAAAKNGIVDQDRIDACVEEIFQILKEYLFGNGE